MVATNTSNTMMGSVSVTLVSCMMSTAALQYQEKNVSERHLVVTHPLTRLTVGRSVPQMLEATGLPL